MKLIGYIKLHRKLLESDVWQLPAEYVQVFIALLLSADWQGEPGWWHGDAKILAALAGVERRVVHKALSRLQVLEVVKMREHEWLTRRTPKRISIYVENWEQYQADDPPAVYEKNTNGSSLYIRNKNIKARGILPSTTPLPTTAEEKVPPSLAKQTLDAYTEAMLKSYGIKCSVTPMDYHNARELAELEGDKAPEIARAYTGLEDKWLEQRGYPLRFIVSRVGQIKMLQRKPRARVASETIQPRCGGCSDFALPGKSYCAKCEGIINAR